jgi:hypothetical protein
MSYIKKKSAKQEERTAKEFGGRTQVASGALWGAKGDVRTDEFLIENKFTDKDYYTFHLKTWEKIREEAIKDSLKVPMMQIDIQEKQYVVMIIWDMLHYMEGEHTKLPIITLQTSRASLKLHKEVLNIGFDEYATITFIQKKKEKLILGVMRKDDFKVLLDTREE